MGLKAETNFPGGMKEDSLSKFSALTGGLKTADNLDCHHVN